jgi:rhodanese-related sulfurtransferase
MPCGVNIAANLSDLPTISREELLTRLRDPSLTIVDVLAEASFVQRHIAGALSLPLELVGSRAREVLPDRSAEIVVYCARTTCDRSEHALRQLQELGYSNVRDYREGLSDWMESGGPIETVAESPSEEDPGETIFSGPPLLVPPNGAVGRGPARVPQTKRRTTYALRLIEQRSTLQLFLIWLGLILICGAGYWLIVAIGGRGLVEAGSPVGADLEGLASTLYFSFVTATSVGYGDIVPVGIVRVMAVAEAVAGLIIFGAVIAKFVSHRQDELVHEIHRLTFEGRLDRVQANLHLVISELLSITSMCEGPHPKLQRVSTRLDSAVLILLGEMRTIHDLLYQRRLIIEEGDLAALLAQLASAMSTLSDLLVGLPPEFARSQSLVISLDRLTRLAEEICSECVPHDYTPRLVFWMDRIQATARTIK